MIRPMSFPCYSLSANHDHSRLGMGMTGEGGQTGRAEEGHFFTHPPFSRAIPRVLESIGEARTHIRFF